ncbi:TIGR02270 family protein [Aliikangiella sp. G2MR2-5]|uniref:TIGR02270 family protein n=1 Tax=Aliikangiella sp. G2MR2-5 TaxID=2788943 RepID=UPI0018ABB00D|nr:TIGR02270 family protein [Aliikangiella sp. G2MR2-5]
MNIIKKLTSKFQEVPNSAFRDIYEQHVTDASFLWLLRCVGLSQPHYSQEDLLELENRIEAHLDGLMTALDISWDVCLEALDYEQPGEIFTVAVVAFRSRDIEKIKTAVFAGLKSPETIKGLVSAMAWLPQTLVAEWMYKFLGSKNLEHKYLAVSVFSVRREFPGEMLTSLLKREDCLAHKPLRARMLRLIGELKRFELRWALDEAYEDEDPEVKFWVNWSTLMLGDKTAAPQLQNYLREDCQLKLIAMNTAFRSLSIDKARMWISKMAVEQKSARLVIEATGVLGDPHAIPWLIEKMRKVETARLAGEAFSMITGIDLEKYGLAIDAPEDISVLPTDDPEDKDVSMDPDENLPFPDVDKVALTWQKYGGKYQVGKRYFMGKEICESMLQEKLNSGLQRQRIAAAYELALLNPQVPLVNIKARTER